MAFVVPLKSDRTVEAGQFADALFHVVGAFDSRKVVDHDADAVIVFQRGLQIGLADVVHRVVAEGHFVHVGQFETAAFQAFVDGFLGKRSGVFSKLHRFARRRRQAARRQERGRRIMRTVDQSKNYRAVLIGHFWLPFSSRAGADQLVGETAEVDVIAIFVADTVLISNAGFLLESELLENAHHGRIYRHRTAGQLPHTHRVE